MFTSDARSSSLKEKLNSGWGPKGRCSGMELHLSDADRKSDFWAISAWDDNTFVVWSSPEETVSATKINICPRTENLKSDPGFFVHMYLGNTRNLYIFENDTKTGEVD